MGRAKPEDVELGRKDAELGPWPILPALAALGAALLGSGLWVGLGLVSTNLLYLPPFLTGGLVGLVVMFTSRADPRMPWVASGVTFVGCWFGFLLVDQFVFVYTGAPRTLGQSIGAIFTYMDAMLLSAIGCYLAWVIASQAGKRYGRSPLGGGG